MDLRSFYEALLPSHGRYCLFSVPRRKHIWAPNLDLLVKLTQRVSTEADWYFATAAFDDERRTQDHVCAKKCFYLDIDAGAGKFARDPTGTYQTNEEARQALISFCRTLALAPTTIVHSGAGLHAYWATDEIGPDEWSPVAKALGAAAKRHGLKVDSSCTTDSARVLRPIGALHNNGRHVEQLMFNGKQYSLDHLRTKLAVPDEPVLIAPPRVRLDVNAGLVMFEPQPTSAMKIAEQCQAIRDVALAKGDVAEPLWRAMIGIVKACVEGVDQAHEWSRGHPDYDPDETEAKYNRYEAGPTTCEHFSRMSPACATCTHWQKIKSPIVLGRMTVEQVEQLPPELKPVPQETPQAEMFEGVDFGADWKPVQDGDKWHLMGRSVVEKKSDVGTVKTDMWIRISEDVIWGKGWVGTGNTDTESAQVNLCVYSNSSKETVVYPMPTASLASARDLHVWMATKGITRAKVDPTVDKLMHNHINNQFTIAHRMLPRPAIRKRFGLQFDGPTDKARMMCAHGKYIIRHNGVIELATIGTNLGGFSSVFDIKSLPPSQTGRWGPTVWRDHIMPAARKQAEFFVKYYTKPYYEVAQLATMLSLASPFMVFAADTVMLPGADLPSVGLTVSLYSSSTAQGKTSLQKAVASCYGDPSAQVYSGSTVDATITAQSARAAVFGTMPYFLDEVTRNAAVDVATLVNRMAMGADKGRADRSGAAREVKTWALITSVSTNVPQREMLAVAQESTDALQMRILELTCEFPNILKGGHIQFERDRDSMLAPNYGSLGALINFLIVHNGPEKMRTLVQARMDEASEILKDSSQRERFLQRGMACVLACHDSLAGVGLKLFDRQTLINEYAAVAKDAVHYAASVHNDPEESLRRMISDFSPHIIVTQDNRFSGVGNPSRMEQVVNRQQLRSPYVGRRVLSERTLYLSAHALNTWCAEHQISAREVLVFMRRNRVFKPGENFGVAKRAVITKNTDLATVAGNCYAIDESGLFDDSWFEVETQDNVVKLERREPPPTSAKENTL